MPSSDADFHAQQIAQLQATLNAIRQSLREDPSRTNKVRLVYAYKELGMEHEIGGGSRITALAAYQIALGYAQDFQLPEQHWLNDRIAALQAFDYTQPFINEFSFPPYSTEE